MLGLTHDEPIVPNARSGVKRRILPVSHGGAGQSPSLLHSCGRSAHPEGRLEEVVGSRLKAPDPLSARTSTKAGSSRASSGGLIKGCRAGRLTYEYYVLTPFPGDCAACPRCETSGPGAGQAAQDF